MAVLTTGIVLTILGLIVGGGLVAMALYAAALFALELFTTVPTGKVMATTMWSATASWAKTLAGELGAYGITVNNVLPGYTQTQRLEQIIADRMRTSGKSAAEIEQAMLASVPAGRFAKPAEIAAAIAFLASPAAAYINGINVPVDGGRMQSL